MLFDVNSLLNNVFRGVIQIGAHHGNEINNFRNLGCKNYLMFEPHPENFSVLQKKTTDGTFKDDESVIVEQLAIGPDGIATMYCETANGGQSNSLLCPALHTLQYPSIQFTSTIEVPVRSLDHYFEERGLERSNYDFLCIDVQGYELEALQTCVEQLKHIKALITEVNRIELYSKCALYHDLCSFLDQYGFEVLRVKWDGITWGDALFVKRGETDILRGVDK
jgi:FkbM family methyltransferase